jgi:hypothetical protein
MDLRKICKIWQEEMVPANWHKAVVVPMLKKGDKSLFDNWLAISLLSVAGKVFTHILL